jgi:hypothetical protein
MKKKERKKKDKEVEGRRRKEGIRMTGLRKERKKAKKGEAGKAKGRRWSRTGARGPPLSGCLTACRWGTQSVCAGSA